MAKIYRMKILTMKYELTEREGYLHLTVEIIDPIMAKVFQQAEFVTPET
jgi:hypothetical protein